MTTGQSANRASRAWSFRQWPLRRKLAAALIFPVLLAFVLGGLRVKSDFDQASLFADAADSTVLLRPVVEYNIAVQRLAAAAAPGGEGLAPAVKAYDQAAASVSTALKAADVSDEVREQTTAALTLGKAVRLAANQTGALSVAIDKSASTASLVSGVVGNLGLNDVNSVTTLVALQDTIAAQRAMTGQQLNLANTDDASGAQNAVKLVGAEGSFVTRLKDEASESNASDVRQLINENTSRGVYLQGATLPADQLGAVSDTFRRSNAAYGSMLDRQLTELESALRKGASEHRTQALFSAALVAGALVAALFIVLALLRSLLTPLRVLRHSALEVARTKLPEAVRRIRDGEEPPKAEPIPIHTTEEMGQLARAVDDLHEQALALAGEQARLRVQVGSMFETLSRRSTSLIDQQLSLIERLERDEEDPQRLQSLFRLDHLAARMRRNSDSLLVLAGTSTRRGLSGSVSIADAVRAAVSEVENYQRIDIGETSDDQVLASVGSDLIHMIAEIVDNALAYSPPSTRVTIHGASTPDGGLLVEVKDAGLGMPPKELEALNERLAHGSDVTTDTARRMGLFVVGSLAQRHGIAVRLRRNGDADKNGITVSLHLPAHLLAERGGAGAQAAGRSPRTAVPPTMPAVPAPAPAPTGGVTAAVPVAASATGGAVAREQKPSVNGLPVRNPMAPGARELGEPGPARAPEAGPEQGRRPFSGLPSRKPGATRITEHTGGTPVPGAPAPSTAPAAPAAAAAATAATAATAPAQDAPARGTTSEPPAPEASRTGAGLPVRRPMATGITEHTGTPATRAEAAAEATADQGGRRWFRLPSRRASDEAAARDAATEEAEHRMPANLSAWLDHRAKLTAAREEATAAASAAEAPSPEATDAPGAAPKVLPRDDAAETGQADTRPAGVFEHASATDDGVQFTPAAELGTASALVDSPAETAEQPGAVTESPAPEGLPRRQRGASGIDASAGQAPESALSWLSDSAASAPAAPQGERRGGGLPTRTPGASGVAGHSTLLNSSPEDTPIFQAMGSSWLTNSDGGQVDSSMSSTAAGDGSTAAGPREAGDPATQAASELPVRRPGGHFSAGADTADEPQQAPAAGGRDPESIRRSLSRHQKGVSSARAETVNGTHREEADVPH